MSSELTVRMACLNLSKPHWEDDLLAVKNYIMIYKRQISRDAKTFEFPMFEHRIKCDGWNIPRSQIKIMKKNMPLTFHVLYAELKILECLISQQ